MKTSELRLGNYIHFKNGIDTVYGIDTKYIMSNHTRRYENENIKPIPLNEEWLLKFGFVKLNDNLFRLGHLQYKAGLLEKGSTGYDSCFMFGVKNITHINHVHSLQNLYHALTGEELTTM